ncbi:MAG TPA: nicotinate-nucleotide--dimethylbenzimidazole phosphoribosyltransferase [Solirubrobacterales bacterium]|jgi:nicotinate-nucleotide--dimethylbenzimidazole phosphoribosyltransferase
MADRFPRPPTPTGYDPSRAAERGADPFSWQYEEERLRAVYQVIAERRDVRRFRADDVDDEILERVLTAAHQAPSVGLMQPWRFIVIRSIETRSRVRSLAQRERLRQASRFHERARYFLDQKIEGVVEAPIGICVCCDHGEDGEEILGRGTIPDTDLYSTACAIENLWLAARAEGLGVGWVSFYRPEELGQLLDLPERVEPIAYLCLGWPDEHPVRPTLETVGWSARLPLSAVVMQERWRQRREDEAHPEAQHGLDRAAVIAARDRLDELVKPAGSLGALEPLIERWAQITGAPPPERIRAGVLICAGDHGHVKRGTSLFDGIVSSQVAAAAARRESAVGVLCTRGEHGLLVADVGLAGPTPSGVLDAKVAGGSADMTMAAALTVEQVEQALATGARLARELAGGGIDCLVLGEIGIGNTTTAAALTCAILGVGPELTVGRGSGLDAAGLERKRGMVTSALALHGSPLPAREALRAVGGLELAALSGAIAAACALRLPVVLDGYAVGVAALVAAQLDPLATELLIASHHSAEPGHGLVLTELGLEPLLDLRLRLGEASGALLALPLIETAGALHRRMGTFEEAGVVRPG